VRRIDFLVQHTAGAYDGKARRVVHQKFEVVRAFHMLPKARYDAAGKLAAGTGGNGWRDIGYHRYIEVDGKIRLGRLDAVVGAHAAEFNAHTLSVCCSGHGDFDPFNDAQMRSLVAQHAAWCRLYALSFDRVIGHRETAKHGGPPVEKSCPGKLIDMDDIRARVRDELFGVCRGVVPGAIGTAAARDDDDEGPPTRRDGSPPARPKT
jgi:hypothetical protein